MNNRTVMIIYFLQIILVDTVIQYRRAKYLDKSTTLPTESRPRR